MLTGANLKTFRAKITISDELIKQQFDAADIPEDFTDEIVVPFYITPKAYLMAKQRWQKAHVYYAETNTYKDFYGNIIPQGDSLYMNKEEDLAQAAKDAGLKNPKFISNPPYGNVGGPVIANIKMAYPQAKQAVLMPTSCWKTAKVKWTDGKTYPLYQFADKIIVVGSAGFDAVISENNCIITLLNEPDTSKTYEDLISATVNQNFQEYYNWNKARLGQLTIAPASYSKYTDFNIDTDFIETNRCGSIKSGAGFGKGGCGYKYNVLRAGYENCWRSGLIVIRCPDKETKDILATLWYSGKRKNQCLLSKAIIGVNITTTSSTCDCALPQLDLKVLPIHQKALWDAGKYDEALLAEMGLKWEGDKIVRA